MDKNQEAVLILEYLNNINSRLRLDSQTLGVMLEEAVDIVLDKPIRDEVGTLISKSEYEHYLELQKIYEEDNF